MKEPLERSYRYVCNGLIDCHCDLWRGHWLQSAVLLFLFGLRTTRPRIAAYMTELAVSDRRQQDAGLAEIASRLWRWLSDAQHRDPSTGRAYGRSLTTPQGPWEVSQNRPCATGYSFFRSSSGIPPLRRLPSNAQDSVLRRAFSTCSPPMFASRPPLRMSWNAWVHHQTLSDPLQRMDWWRMSRTSTGFWIALALTIICAALISLDP